MGKPMQTAPTHTTRSVQPKKNLSQGQAGWWGISH